jgi:hypothetical protein
MLAITGAPVDGGHTDLVQPSIHVVCQEPQAVTDLDVRNGVTLDEAVEVTPRDAQQFADLGRQKQPR